MAPTYEKRFIPRIVTKGLDCEGAASCTALTTGAGSLTAPAIVCPTDADTGLLWSGKDLQFAVDGSVRVFCTTNGLNTARYEVQSRMRGYRANGTDTSPTATVDGNILFEFGAYGHNGTGFAPCAALRFTQDGAVSGSTVPGEIVLVSRSTSGSSVNVARVRASGAFQVLGELDHDGSTLGFYNTTPTTKPTITGSRGANAALADLLTKLAGLGLLTDSTTA
jgi:hypothetical protein